jgi:hypothetical protein
VIFVASAYISFIYEYEYRNFIRWLYEILSEHKISFVHPRKYIHFASGYFVFSVASFFVVVFLTSIRLNWKQILLNSLLSFTLYSVSILTYAYFDGKLRLIECSKYDNGIRTLKYNDIAYDQIMILSIFVGLLPWLISNYKKWRKNKKLVSPS